MGISNPCSLNVSLESDDCNATDNTEEGSNGHIKNRDKEADKMSFKLKEINLGKEISSLKLKLIEREVAKDTFAHVATIAVSSIRNTIGQDLLDRKHTNNSVLCTPVSLVTKNSRWRRKQKAFKMCSFHGKSKVEKYYRNRILNKKGKCHSNYTIRINALMVHL